MNQPFCKTQVKYFSDVLSFEYCSLIVVEQITKIELQDVYVESVDFMRGVFRYTIIVLVVAHCLSRTWYIQHVFFHFVFSVMIEI
jgi:hypothetical protein